MTDRGFYGGLIRLHLLHHASTRPLYGFAMIEALARHGYRLSPGTLYPILHGLEKKGYLCSAEQRLGRTARRIYQITPSGRRALEGAKQRVHELFGEMFLRRQ
jgi:PadR family transcriptional regulator, regulatory protein PadR